jgi:metal-sulfur cluster biosynthetic enzyme
MSQPDQPEKLVWTLESTDPEQADHLKTKLREVIDPEIGLNIIELGLVRDAEVIDDKLRVKMILTTPFCPYGPAMLDMTRKKAEGALGLPTEIEMGVEMWDLSMMEDGAAGDWGMF